MLTQTLFSRIAGSVVRHALTAGAAILVDRGVLVPGETSELITGLTGLLVALLWSGYNKYVLHRDAVQGLAL